MTAIFPVIWKGVEQAVDNVNEIIAPEITGWNVFDQVGLDKLLIELDGTPVKANSARTPS